MSDQQNLKNQLKTKSGNINLPLFFPDATKAVIKGVGADDLERCNVDGLVVNTYHLMQDKMVDIIESVGGIHAFMGYKRPVLSDSGGFQVMSLVRENPKNGHICEDGVTFKLKEEVHLSPESCIQTQIKLGTDIIMCLDDCTNIKETLSEQEKSVARTIRWAAKCKESFEKLTLNTPEGKKPLIFAIVQGGNVKELRKECALELEKIGFDGYAYGGWPVDENRNFLNEILAYTSSVMPADKPKYAMGVGKPQDIVDCVSMGYNMFDCVLPTRDARHKRMYTFADSNKKTFEYVNLGNQKNIGNNSPISKWCDCETCKNYSLGYIHHLFSIRDALSVRLSTIHNLRFYSMLMESLR